jgi:competence protein ComEC
MLKKLFGSRAWVQQACGRHPLFAITFAVVGSVAGASFELRWGIFSAILFGFIGGLIGNRRLALASVVLGGIAIAGLMWRIDSRNAAEANLLHSASGTLTGKVLADAKGETFWAAPVRVISGAAGGTKVWWKSGGEPPVAGAIITGRGSFQPLPVPRNPGEFDQAAWLRGQGMAVVFQVAATDCSITTGRFAALVAQIRRGFRTAVTAGLADDSQQARVIRAIVLGELPHDSEVLIAAFRNSGTLHAFSVSGLHVAMVGTIGWWLLRLLGVPRRWAVPLLLPLVFGYSWLTGNSPPAVRSAWMAAVFLSAFVCRRRPDLLNALGGVALVALVWDGRLLFQPGVQLSYGVVAAIALGSGWTSRAFTKIAQPELYLPRSQWSRWQLGWLGFRRKIAQSLGVSLAAGIGSTPLTAFHFGLVTPIALVAGLVLIPLVFVLLSMALGAALVFPVAPSLTRWVNTANAKIADVCVLTAEGFSAIPAGHFQLRAANQPSLLVYDLDRGAAAACFDGGSAAASVLIDCGDPFSFKHRIVPSLRRLGLAPDSVILSHPDGGHLGGGAAVWEAFPIQQALLPVARSRSPALRAWAQAAPLAGIRVMQAKDLRWLPLPAGARLEILQVPDPFGQNVIADERVVIFRLHWQGWKILLTSDAGQAAEQKLLDSHQDLRADLIIAGHHRSDLSLSDPFLAAVNPQAILASNAAFPISERLSPRRTAYWKSRAIQLVDPVQTGGVTVTIDPQGQLCLAGFVDHSCLILNHR